MPTRLWRAQASTPPTAAVRLGPDLSSFSRMEIKLKPEPRSPLSVPIPLKHTPSEKVTQHGLGRTTAERLRRRVRDSPL